MRQQFPEELPLNAMHWEGHSFPWQQKGRSPGSLQQMGSTTLAISLHSSWRLLPIADSLFEASLLIRAFPNSSHLRREAKQGNDFQRETPCPGKTFCLERWAQETRHRNRCFDSPPPQPALLSIWDATLPFPWFGAQLTKGQQHTSHTISINDKSLITYTVCKAIFFWKCTHCLVIYLLRSLIKGQQS